MFGSHMLDRFDYSTSSIANMLLCMISSHVWSTTREIGLVCVQGAKLMFDAQTYRDLADVAVSPLVPDPLIRIRTPPAVVKAGSAHTFSVSTDRFGVQDSLTLLPLSAPEGRVLLEIPGFSISEVSASRCEATITVINRTDKKQALPSHIYMLSIPTYGMLPAPRVDEISI